ncbi:fungal-specific transcription factor domain-containing protein [Aspergillus ambiguus]|uniref:transcription factor domain-containing protein n=1 Tax=Aspergillus ambiguus TaxID=176160 RepID=UPI003CCCA3C0
MICLIQIRCDGERPACETCYFAGVTCTFTARPIPQNKSLREQLSEAKARIRELEELVASQGSQPSLAHSSPDDRQSSIGLPDFRALPPCVCRSLPSLPDTSDFDVAVERFRWHLACSGLLLTSSPQTEVFLATVQRQTGSPFDFENFISRVAQSYKSQYPATYPKVVSPKWPKNELIQRSIKYFSDENLYSIFPVVEPHTLPDIFNQYLSSSTDPRTRTAVTACLVSLTALITKMFGHQPIFADADPDAYVQASLTLLPQIITDPDNLRTLESLLLLALYIAPTGHPRSAQLLLAAAARILYNFEGHKCLPSNRQKNHEHLRALFWAFYGMDKETSVRCCQPPIMHDADCDLQLPSKYVRISSDTQFLPGELSPQVLLYPADLRLAMLKSKIYQLLYSENAQAQPESRRLERIRQLDQELNDLKTSFPASFRPDPRTGHPPGCKLHTLSVRGMSVHFDYYHCFRMIHEAGIACSMSGSNRNPLASSVELYYHASRSMLLHYIRTEDLIQPPTFW